MRPLCCALLVWMAACSNPKPQATATPSGAPASAPRITQFYTTAPTLPGGSKGLVCYGVENATKVWLTPPRQELSAALARCVEVEPAATTTYKLTAEGAAGPAATQELTVTVGPPPVKIVDVTVSSLEITRGSTISICFHARNASRVEIAPAHFRSPDPAKGCLFDRPRQTTAYTVNAIGASGDNDQEHVTVRVK